MEREQLGPTRCETRTSTTDERKSHTANLSKSSTEVSWFKVYLQEKIGEYADIEPSKGERL